MTPNADDPSARVVRVDVPLASPGQCGICGKNEHPQGFAYFGMDFEFYGTLYFCRDCVGDFARVFGFTAPEDMTTMHEQLAEQSSDIAILREAVAGLENTVDELTGLNQLYRRNSLPIASSGVVVGEPESAIAGEFPAAPVEELPTEQPALAQPVGETNSVSNEQGRADLHDVTTSADALLGLGS